MKQKAMRVARRAETMTLISIKEYGAAETASTAEAEIPRSLKTHLAEAHSEAAVANAELVEMRTEHRQMTLAESPVTRTATSVTAAAQESTAKRAMTLLKVSKAELAYYSKRPTQSDSDACSGAATTAVAAEVALKATIEDLAQKLANEREDSLRQLRAMSAELLRGRNEATCEMQESQMMLEELGIKYKAAHSA